MFPLMQKRNAVLMSVCVTKFLLKFLRAGTTEDEIKAQFKARKDELIPNHIIIDDIFSTINFMNCLAVGLGTLDDIRPFRRKTYSFSRRAASKSV